MWKLWHFVSCKVACSLVWQRGDGDGASSGVLHVLFVLDLRYKHSYLSVPTNAVSIVHEVVL
jgi:hypothetical protein